MTSVKNASQENGKRGDAPEPHWPILVTLLAVGGLYMALPRSLTLGPRGLLLEIVCLLLIPTFIAMWTGHHDAQRRLGFLILGIITVSMTFSLALLVHALPLHTENPKQLLGSAVALWASNVLVFAQWYWRLDAGGPFVRGKTLGHMDGAFLFPQMTMSEEARKLAGEEDWAPTFVDYLFLAFNTSTAFSPTDTLVLTRWAKVLMMVQSLISLAVIVLLAGRVVNIF
ncbi:hypothetical protein CCAX7_009520 [Capsulimonas corticalis]|uniref:Uncharacterized protein n=1 Tax=Capsulimonas corticalis TaxID=2219043 RepID=A0A402CUB0_9BACT|nr:DUF1345 domain-containing protein [Capsulimonas corticalis]BDI28901.1 hypothetical protein CCAX7_009520 [Capsulimonas corticalis]